MKSYKHINLYPSKIIATCYRLVLNEKIYIWFDLGKDLIETKTLSPANIQVLKNPIFNP